jgi:hypothetical protein
MIAQHNRTSLLFGIPGALLQFPGPFVTSFLWPQEIWVQRGVIALGTILLIIGLSYYARAKGQSPWYGALAVLSWLGYLVLALLPDKSGAVNRE